MKKISVTNICAIMFLELNDAGLIWNHVKNMRWDERWTLNDMKNAEFLWDSSMSVFPCIYMNENLCSYAFLYEKMVLSCSMSMKSNDDEMNICK
jgi:hypothetical protein